MLESFTRTLPWLLVHGAWMGTALLVTCVVAGALVAASWTRGAARLLAAWQCTRLGPPLRALDAARAASWVVVEGIIRFVEGQRRLELADGTLLELAGPMRAYLRARGRAPFVIAGDRVRVGGILKPTASLAARGYRDGTAPGWCLVSAGEALEVVLFSPRAVLASPSWRACSGLAGAALGALLACASFEALGRLGGGDVARLRAGERALLSELASVDPGWRATVLRRFERGYRQRLDAKDTTEADEDRLVAVLWMRGDCAEAAHLLLLRGRAPLAESLAAQCKGPGAREIEAMAAYEIGNLREASAAWQLAAVEAHSTDPQWWPRARAALRTHILAQAWDVATSEASRFAAAAPQGPRREQLRCLAGGLTAAGGALEQVAEERTIRDPVAWQLHCLRAAAGKPHDHDVEPAAGAPSDDWLLDLIDAVELFPRRLPGAAMAIPVTESDAVRGWDVDSLHGMGPSLEATLMDALDRMPSVPARLASARLALRRAAFEALVEPADDSKVRRWFAVARHRLREAHTSAVALRRYPMDYGHSVYAPDGFLGSGCVTLRRRPPSRPWLTVVPFEQALEIHREEPEGPIPAELVAPGIAEALAATRAAIEPLESGAWATRGDMGRTCGSAQAASRRAAQHGWQQTIWDKPAIEGMRAQARLAQLVDLAAAGREGVHLGPLARTAANHLHAALRSRDVGVLVAMLEAM